MPCGRTISTPIRSGDGALADRAALVPAARAVCEFVLLPAKPRPHAGRGKPVRFRALAGHALGQSLWWLLRGHDAGRRREGESHAGDRVSLERSGAAQGECIGWWEFALRLRIPGWASGATLRVNQRPMELDAKPGHYVTLRRAWEAGDVIDLDLPMKTRLMESHPLVEETFKQLAVQRGPLVYCLESADVPKALTSWRWPFPRTSNSRPDTMDDCWGRCGAGRSC